MRHWSEETNWQPLSAVVECLKKKVDAAIAARDEFTAEVAHNDLVSAEHRLRMAERGRNRNG